MPRATPQHLFVLHSPPRFPQTDRRPCARRFYTLKVATGQGVAREDSFSTIFTRRVWISFDGRNDGFSDGTFEIFFTTSRPWITCPKTVNWPVQRGSGRRAIMNWELFAGGARPAGFRSTV